MRQSHPVSHFLVILCVLVNFNLSLVYRGNQIFHFDDCDQNYGVTHTIDGALVKSQKADTYEGMGGANCSMDFLTPDPKFQFLVQFEVLDIWNGTSDGLASCVDSLTVLDYYDTDAQQLAQKILSNFCGVRPEFKVYSKGQHLSITWNTGQSVHEPHRGFKLVLTALSRMPEPCDSVSHIRCSNNDCISLSLRCDGVAHCATHDDETQCVAQQELTSSSPSPAPHPPVKPTLSLTTTEETYNGPKEVYLWLPLIVVVVFTGVMVTLILIGRKSETEHQIQQGTAAVLTSTLLTSTATTTTVFDDPSFTKTEVIYMALMACVFCLIVVVCLVIGKRGSRASEELSTLNSCNTSEALALTDERNGLRVDVNGNPNYEPEPGMPSTPPPSYSVIERQTSYVSHISVSSSQMSEPPDYNDALELPGDPAAPSHRMSRSAQRHSSRRAGASRRRNSGGSTSSRFARLRQRIFSRSVSAQEARYRHRSSASDASEADPTSDIARITELSDIVFEDETSTPMAVRGDGDHTEHPISHSTPHDILSTTNNQSSLRQTTDQNSHGDDGGPTVSRSVSQVTGATSIGSSISDESNPPAVATDIFAQIHSLNHTGSREELDRSAVTSPPTEGVGGSAAASTSAAGINPAVLSGNEGESTLQSDLGNVSDVALLSHAQEPSVELNLGENRPAFF